jgi:hypothetical protein
LKFHFRQHITKPRANLAQGFVACVSYIRNQLMRWVADAVLFAGAMSPSTTAVAVAVTVVR